MTADIWLALVCFLKKAIIFNFDCNLFKTQISHEHGVVWGYAKKKSHLPLGHQQCGTSSQYQQQTAVLLPWQFWWQEFRPLYERQTDRHTVRGGMRWLLICPTGTVARPGRWICALCVSSAGFFFTVRVKGKQIYFVCLFTVHHHSLNENWEEGRACLPCGTNLILQSLPHYILYCTLVLNVLYVERESGCDSFPPYSNSFHSSCI